MPTPPPPSPPPKPDSPHETTAVPALAALEERIRNHYAKYVDGTRFDFFAADFAPRVERYLSLRDIDVSALQAEARRFFRDKKSLAFTPKPGSFVAKPEGSRNRVEFQLNIARRQSMSPSLRITDFNSGRGAGCHQHAMGHAWERYMDAGAVPALGKQAKRFLNWDMNTLWRRTTTARLCAIGGFICSTEPERSRSVSVRASTRHAVRLRRAAGAY